MAGIALLYLVRYGEHAKALALVAAPEVLRASANPYPINPFQWHVVTDDGDHYQLSTVHTREGLSDPASPADTIYKAAATLPVLVAKRSYLGRIYLDWSQYPVLNETPDTSDPNHPLTSVTFSDARFFYNVSFFHGRPESGSAPPLSGTVLLDMSAPEGQRVVETRMGSRLQK